MGVVIKANFNLHPSVHCPPNTRIPENAFAEDDPFGPDYNYLDYRDIPDRFIVPDKRPAAIKT